MPAAGKEHRTDLIAEAVTGNERAQTDLWRSHRRWLAAILLSHKPREIDLEDLMQDVAVKFITKLHTLRDPGSFRPWLRQIAINAARESARSIRRERNEREHVEPETLDGSGLGRRDDAGLRDEASELLAYAQSLPPDFREPVLLRCVQGMSCKQIAETLDLPITTIETRLSRGRRMLREEWMSRNEGNEHAAARVGTDR